MLLSRCQMVALFQHAATMKPVAADGGDEGEVWEVTLTATMKTGSGLAKGDLVKSQAGKIASKKPAAEGKKRRWSWMAAVAAARKALKIKGRVKQGTTFYKKAIEVYKARLR